MIEKIWLVTQESNMNGELLFNVVPCINEETARQVMNDEIETLLHEGHFESFADSPDDFILEQTGTSYFIKDPYDDYYEYISIEEKAIQY